MGTNKPPNAEQNAFALNCSSPGLNKREYFAAMAMQGLLANHALVGRYEHNGEICTSLVPDDLMATQSLRFADALLAALNK